MSRQRQQVLKQISEIVAIKYAIEMYSTHSKGKSLRTIYQTLKKENYEDMTSISKNIYIDKLDDILNT